MKTADVHLGHIYVVNISGDRRRVRLDSVRSFGGWDATNLKTKRIVGINSARRILGKALNQEGATCGCPRSQAAVGIDPVLHP